MSDNGAGAYVSGTGVWTIGSLANAASTALQITATVNATGPYANTATVTGSQDDPTPGNNTSTNTPVPVPQADLAVVKTVNNATPNVGSTIVFTLTATNNGPSAATGVAVNDLLPAGYTYVSDNGAGAYVSGTGVWTIGNLANAGNRRAANHGDGQRDRALRQHGHRNGQPGRPHAGQQHLDQHAGTGSPGGSGGRQDGE